jgi:hypothetical protein
MERKEEEETFNKYFAYISAFSFSLFFNNQNSKWQNCQCVNKLSAQNFSVLKLKKIIVVKRMPIYARNDDNCHNCMLANL